MASREFMAKDYRPVRLVGERFGEHQGPEADIGHVFGSMFVDADLAKTLGWKDFNGSGWLVQMEIENPEAIKLLETGELSEASIGGKGVVFKDIKYPDGSVPVDWRVIEEITLCKAGQALCPEAIVLAKSQDLRDAWLKYLPEDVYQATLEAFTKSPEPAPDTSPVGENKDELDLESDTPDEDKDMVAEKNKPEEDAKQSIESKKEDENELKNLRKSIGDLQAELDKARKQAEEYRELQLLEKSKGVAGTLTHIPAGDALKVELVHYLRGHEKADQFLEVLQKTNGSLAAMATPDGASETSRVPEPTAQEKHLQRAKAYAAENKVALPAALIATLEEK